jgi:hypothetical protein
VTDQQSCNEWNRLVFAPIVADVLAHNVADLTSVATDEQPAWLQQLHLPTGWRLAQFDANPIQPTRIAVCGPHPDGGWDGCETINLFRFIGNPPDGLVQDTSDRMLRSLGADSVTSYPLSIPPVDQITAIRSSGCFRAVGQRIWLQYTTYLAGSEPPDLGILIEHGIFVDSTRQVSLRDDITELTNAIHDAFVSTIAATPEQNVLTSTNLEVSSLPPSKETRMARFRVEPFDDAGYPAILANADRDGMRMFQSAVRSAHETGAATFELDEIKHFVVRQDGGADIDIRSQTVVWRFDDAKLVEMLNLIEPLVNIEKPAHNYLDDLISPVETLVLSVDEYTT